MSLLHSTLNGIFKQYKQFYRSFKHLTVWVKLLPFSKHFFFTFYKNPFFNSFYSSAVLTSTNVERNRDEKKTFPINFPRLFLKIANVMLFFFHFFSCSCWEIQMRVNLFYLLFQSFFDLFYRNHGPNFISENIIFCNL